MMRLLARLAVPALAVLALSGRAAGGDEPPRRASLAAIEKAFQGGRGRDLAPVLGKGRRIWLAVEPVREGEGFLGTDQLIYVLDQFFDRHPTRRFTLDRGSVARSGEPLEVRAAWQYADGEESRRVTLVFSLAEESGAWLLTSIRSTGS